MLHLETVFPGTLDLLKEIQSLPGLEQMRLVGGTALALQLGHRMSVDLELFGHFDSQKSFRKLLQDAGHAVDGADSGEVQTLTVDGIKVDFVNYPYDWITEPVREHGIVLAGMADVIAMKISAAANRGKKKDFVDIATLLKDHSLAKMFAYYQRKFSVSEISFALRGLTYFDDAEGDPMTRMLVNLTWSDVKCQIADALRSFARFE